MPNNNDLQNPFTPADNSSQDIDQNTNQDFNQAPVNQNYQMPSQAQVNTPLAMEEEQEYPQDPRIAEYLVNEVIPAKNPNMAADQVVAEKDRLYKILESGIFDTAYSQLQEDQKTELDTLMKYGANIAAIQTFFIEKIPNIQEQLGKYMQEFVQKYLRGEM